MTLNLSESEAAQLQKNVARGGLNNPERPRRDKRTVNHANLKGGLPFEAKTDGTPRKAKPLAARTTALSPAQAISEDQHLIDFFSWSARWERLFPCLGGLLCFHTENERLLDPASSVTRRNPRTGKNYKINLAGMQRKKKGVKRGILDVLNLRPARGYAYFAGELKVRDRECSEEQLEFIQQAREAGAFAHTFWCGAELRRAMVWYFGLTDKLLYLSCGDPQMFLIPNEGGHDEKCGCGVKLTDLTVFLDGRVIHKELTTDGPTNDTLCEPRSALEPVEVGAD